MYEGIYQELFLLCTNGERIHKCPNITRNKYFISNSSRKMFCSHKCTSTVTKRGSASGIKRIQIEKDYPVVKERNSK